MNDLRDNGVIILNTDPNQGNAGPGAALRQQPRQGTVYGGPLGGMGPGHSGPFPGDVARNAPQQPQHHQYQNQSPHNQYSNMQRLHDQQQQQQRQQRQPAYPCPPPINSIPPEMREMRRQTVEICDLTKDTLTNSEARELLTRYVIFRFEKAANEGEVDEEGYFIPPSWKKVIRTEEKDMDKQAAIREIRRLDKNSESVVEKKALLDPDQNQQLEYAREELETNETDSRFHYVLAQVSHTLKQLDKHTLKEYYLDIEREEWEDGSSRRAGRKRTKPHRSKKDGKAKPVYERTSIIAFFKRVPKEGEDAISIYLENEAEPRRAPHHFEPLQQVIPPRSHLETPWERFPPPHPGQQFGPPPGPSYPQQIPQQIPLPPRNHFPPDPRRDEWLQQGMNVPRDNIMQPRGDFNRDPQQGGHQPPFNRDQQLVHRDEEHRPSPPLRTNNQPNLEQGRPMGPGPIRKGTPSVHHQTQVTSRPASRAQETRPLPTKQSPQIFQNAKTPSIPQRGPPPPGPGIMKGAKKVPAAAKIVQQGPRPQSRREYSPASSDDSTEYSRSTADSQETGPSSCEPETYVLEPNRNLGRRQQNSRGRERHRGHSDQRRDNSSSSSSSSSDRSNRGRSRSRHKNHNRKYHHDRPAYYGVGHHTRYDRTSPPLSSLNVHPPPAILSTPLATAQSEAILDKLEEISTKIGSQQTHVSPGSAYRSYQRTLPSPVGDGRPYERDVSFDALRQKRINDIRERERQRQVYGSLVDETRGLGNSHHAFPRRERYDGAIYESEVRPGRPLSSPLGSPPRQTYYQRDRVDGYTTSFPKTRPVGGYRHLNVSES